MEANRISPRPAAAISEPGVGKKSVRPAARVGEGKSRRGFASMDPARQRLIAAEGGKASHSHGLGHRWTAEQAREAGRKGGLISRRKPSTNTPGK